ncbi:hypothetical protein CASFOL_021585 [Castilleja foliolosa]|uniref:Uncharacterized protein n=1 Tax=Castilleja foliolosa TaxID=1961234 RepID=A0ABD3CZ04_9LAMI
MSGNILPELEKVLRSSKRANVPLTLQESKVLMACREQSLRDFYVVLCGSVGNFARSTRRLLRSSDRGNLALGVGAACSFWTRLRSDKSSVQHILSLEGSRIQKELINILMKKYQHMPWVMQLLSKQFYSEEVYDDSSVDRPTFRWRYRNFSGEPFNHYQSIYYGDEPDSNENDTKKVTLEPNQVHMKVSGDAPDDPFDLVFGFSESAENVAKPVELGTLSRKQRHKKRSDLFVSRYRRYHHEEESEI